ncbi:MAG: hypothetical protein J5486_04725 [Bacteroidaceae bacterium]|nr:hypothetical protein [Bacteroidaceae bacterium]
MATLTSEQIEAKKQQLKQLTEEAKAIYDELVEAGAIELSDDDLEKASGGLGVPSGAIWYGPNPVPVSQQAVL